MSMTGPNEALIEIDRLATEFAKTADDDLSAICDLLVDINENCETLQCWHDKGFEPHWDVYTSGANAFLEWQQREKNLPMSIGALRSATVACWVSGLDFLQLVADAESINDRS